MTGRYREKTVKITSTNIPNAFTGTKLVNFTTDTDTDEIIGIKAIRVNDGGLAYYNVGLKPQSGGQYVKDVTHVDDLVASTAVSKNDRWNEVSAPAGGQSYSVEIETPAGVSTTNANFELHFQVRYAIK